MELFVFYKDVALFSFFNNKNAMRQSQSVNQSGNKMG